MDAVVTRPVEAAARTLAVEVVSDVICPWCFVGKRRMEQASRQLGDDLRLAVRWRPFQLNPTMPKEGLDRRTYRTAKFGSWEPLVATLSSRRTSCAVRLLAPIGSRVR